MGSNGKALKSNGKDDKVKGLHEERDNRLGYTLTAILEGFMVHNEKYDTSPAKMIVTSDLISREGNPAPKHVLLNLGSKIDSLDLIRVVYSNVKTHATAEVVAKVITGKDGNYFSVYGQNDKSEKIEPHALVDSKGEKYWSKAKCSTARFLARDVISKLIPLTSPETFGKAVNHENTIGKLESRKFTLEGQVKRTALKMIDLEVESEAYKNLNTTLEDYMGKLESIKRDIEKLNQSSEVVDSSDKLAKMQALLDAKLAAMQADKKA
jgi:hypothetical protein